MSPPPHPHATFLFYQGLWPIGGTSQERALRWALREWHPTLLLVLVSWNLCPHNLGPHPGFIVSETECWCAAEAGFDRRPSRLSLLAGGMSGARCRPLCQSDFCSRGNLGGPGWGRSSPRGTERVSAGREATQHWAGLCCLLGAAGRWGHGPGRPRRVPGGASGREPRTGSRCKHGYFKAAGPPRPAHS